ncbi:MAG TPA: cellulase family glycosylhydrolase [Chloroflexota bacterium]
MSRMLRLILGIALLGAVVGCTSTTAPPSPTAAPTVLPRPTPVDLSAALRIDEPVAPLGIQVFLWGNAPTTDRDLQLAKDAGFTWIKQRFEWRYIEPNKKGEFQWEEPDRIVAAAARHGLKILARVDNQPKWARSDDLFPGTGPPDDLQDWADFLTALATRYRGRIAAYQLWNEPNLDREWGNRPPNAAEYVELLRVGYGAIKAADPNAIVITAGMAPTTTNNDNARPDVVFVQQMYDAGASKYFDMLGVHGAGFKAPPEADPGQVAQDPALTNNDSSPVEQKRVYAFRHVEDLRELMVRNGDGGKQIAVLEMGWTSDPRPDSPYRWHAVSEEERADYLVRAIRFAREHWRPWIGVLSLIYLPDPNWTPEMEQYYWSLTRPDGTALPAYEAIRQAFGPAGR